MAQPLDTLERVNRNEDMRRLRELVREHGVKQIVVTSWEAERLLEEVQGRFIREEKRPGAKKARKDHGKMTVDAVAAAVILKEYLEKQERAAEKA